MNFPRKSQSLFTYEGIVFTLIFTLLFSTAHLIMIDAGGLGSLIKTEAPLYILIFTVIFIYLQRNSKVVFTSMKFGFYSIWIVYILSVFITDFAAGDFSLIEAAVYILISLIFLYKIPSELLMFLLTGGVISGLLLLFGSEGSGVSVAAALILISGLILLPKNNQAFLFYLLPAAAVILTIPFSSTALITTGGIFTAHLILINILSSKRYISPVIVTLTAVIIFSAIYVFEKSFTEENLTLIFDSILDKNGIITLILFILLLLYTAVISVPFPAAENISLYFIAFSALVIYEPEFFTEHAVFTPSVVLILLLSIILSNKRKHDYLF